MRIRGLVAVTAAALALAGCSPTNENAAEESSGDVTFTDGVVRAKGTDKEMTGIFGTFHNGTDEDVTVTGFTADVEGTYEIHEVVDGVMQEKEGGITIPAGGSHEMAPGGDHLMILDHPAEIPAGDVVDLTIELGNGETLEVEDVAVRTMNPGDEDYGEDGELSGHEPEHDH